MGLHIITNKDPMDAISDYNVILVGTNIYNRLSNGFQRQIRDRYPQVDVINQKTKYGDMHKLGKRLTIEGTPTVSLMYICTLPRKDRVSIDYEALENCLKTANKEFKGQKLMTTVAGGSIFDGNGKRGVILKIMERSITDCDLYIYDYIQPNIYNIQQKKTN